VIGSGPRTWGINKYQTAKLSLLADDVVVTIFTLTEMTTRGHVADVKCWPSVVDVRIIGCHSILGCCCSR